MRCPNPKCRAKMEIVRPVGDTGVWLYCCPRCGKRAMKRLERMDEERLGLQTRQDDQD